MKHYHYLVVGGGMTADAAVKGIREFDPQGSIGLISAESQPPYDRPPLSKGLWKGKPLEAIFRGTSDLNVDLYLGRRAQALDAKAKRLVDDLGDEYTYDKLLLATGGRPRRLPFGGEHILYFRTLEDYQHLQTQTGKDKRFAVIGGGFIGSEIAAALAMKGQEVVMLFPKEGIGWRMFPPDLSMFLNDYYREKGVKVLAGELLSGLEAHQNGLSLELKSGREIVVDHVVAGIGIIPNTSLAESAGLEVGDGIVVNQYLRTSHPDIYAAGDVASFHNPTLDMRMRVEHEDNANTMGRLAGGNMARSLVGTEQLPYDHLPYFYSDLFDLGYEAVGDLNPALETVADWQEPYKKGLVYYLKDGRVRGVLAWNVWDQVEHARHLIAEPGPFTKEELKQRLPV